MRTFGVVFLALLVSGAWGQGQPADGPITPPEKPDPNVVVLNGEARFWKDPKLDRLVSLSLTNANLSAAISALAKSSKLNLVAHGGPKANSKVTLSLKKVPLRDAMRTLEESYGLRWHKVGEIYSLENDPKHTARFLPMSAFKRPALVPMQSGVKLIRGRNRIRRAKPRIKVFYQIPQ